ncbi:MAG: L,D-transpeptidase family protein [Methylocella sp.]
MLCKPIAKRLFAFSLIASASGLLAGCEESTFSPVTARSAAPLPPKTLAAMESIGSSKNAPVLIRTYKKEAELEIWKMKADGHYAYLKSFPMCRWSGQLGPKVREGDRQVPEGFYSITPARMNPKSAYYLSFDVGYPNAYDRAMGHTGGSIMVHGVCSSAGCFSMTDAQIAEIYAIAREAFAGGQRAIQMQSYPFRMTAENLAKYRLDPNIGFWNQLKEGSDNFEVTKQDVVVGVCNKHYVFNAAPAGGSHFDATAACPPLKRNGETQAEVAAKQKRDEAKIAELAAQGVRPVRTVYADGGQHPDFASLASYASRPEALAKGPVDIALDEGKSKKARRMAAAKPGAIRTAANSVQGQSPKPVELVTAATVATAAPEPAKPQDSSLFARLWGGKPAEANAETPSLPATETTVPQPSEVPLPPRRNEASTAIAKPRDANGKPQNSVAVPAPVKPQAAASPAGAAAERVAFLRAKISTIAQADH